VSCSFAAGVRPCCGGVSRHAMCTGAFFMLCVFFFVFPVVPRSAFILLRWATLTRAFPFLSSWQLYYLHVLSNRCWQSARPSSVFGELAPDTSCETVTVPWAIVEALRLVPVIFSREPRRHS
jgi:hypothetical protein